ncbi:hypothetical protein EH243_13445 [Amphritea opalescens]|uniref:Uncharacterized protein n=1 Tax=Amphritea opalescens TaxID=2490544 RepID=A0A430KP41_9GAMM|nr:hypothetical protein [Amphritea opalescens]RTE65240.1 hypothetical protein EH243_13445 [Amphritea opalescens]
MLSRIGTVRSSPVPYKMWELPLAAIDIGRTGTVRSSPVPYNTWELPLAAIDVGSYWYGSFLIGTLRK